MNIPKHEVFDKYLEDYEKWFEDNFYVYQSELAALRKLIPTDGEGVEIGVGSGIFAKPLGIKNGCDPSEKMREKAKERGINAIYGVAENLPYPSESFDFAIMVTTLCFVDDPDKAIAEVYRILKNNGNFIVAFVDKDSLIGKEYLKHKDESVFYKNANFFSTVEVYELLERNNFKIIDTIQTIFGRLEDIKQIQEPAPSYGKGSFVVIKAKK
jgi:ubiquinone/menaquinone biosynthesis C-methylase UbiE